MCFEDFESDDDGEEFEELFSIIPDTSSADDDEECESQYEDLDDEKFDIDF